VSDADGIERDERRRFFLPWEGARGAGREGRARKTFGELEEEGPPFFPRPVVSPKKLE